MVRDAKYRKGDVVYRQGADANEVFFVKFGSVELYVDYGTEDEKRIGVVAEGKVFGELGVIEGKPRTMTAVAAEDTVTTVVDKASFPEYIKAYPNKMILVMESISSRIRAQSRKLVTACMTVAEYADEKEKHGSVDKELLERMKTLARKNTTG